MAVCNDPKLAERMRMMSLHGLSNDAWHRYSSKGAWDYRISAPGYKYNLTDIAASIGIHQLARAEKMRKEREAIAQCYQEELAGVEEIETPRQISNRIHSWHLYPLRLRLERLSIDRNEFIERLKSMGIGCSVHWRPLHLHPYHREAFGWRPEDFKVATAVWERLISVPIFQGMKAHEIRSVINAVRKLCVRFGKN